MASETPARAPVSAARPEVRAEDGVVRLRALACALTPEAADALAEQLRAAADEARAFLGRPARERPKPPFPPSELVSPHGAA